MLPSTATALIQRSTIFYFDGLDEFSQALDRNVSAQSEQEKTVYCYK